MNRASAVQPCERNDEQFGEHSSRNERAARGIAFATTSNLTRCGTPSKRRSATCAASICTPQFAVKNRWCRPQLARRSGRASTGVPAASRRPKPCPARVEDVHLRGDVGGCQRGEHAEAQVHRGVVRGVDDETRRSSAGHERAPSTTLAGIGRVDAPDSAAAATRMTLQLTGARAWRSEARFVGGRRRRADVHDRDGSSRVAA